jgi:hypothetical protein
MLERFFFSVFSTAPLKISARHYFKTSSEAHYFFTAELRLCFALVSLRCNQSKHP